MKSSGALVVVGGGNLPASARDRFLQLAGGKDARLVVVPTASARADRADNSSSYHYWRSQSVASVEFLHTRNRQQADDPSFARPLTTATGVWLSGGDQSRLTAVYQNTNVLRELRKVLERGGVIGGTSAGASVMSTMMITGGTKAATLDTGFGLIPGMVVDQHFTNRNRMSRLMSVLAQHPEMVGVGIDEQTAMVLQQDSLDVVGDGSVWVCLAPTPTQPVSTQRLKSGDHLSLASLAQTLLARSKTAPDKTTIATAGSTSSPSPPSMGMGMTMSPGKGR
jgi:cyanophycinase